MIIRELTRSYGDIGMLGLIGLVLWRKVGNQRVRLSGNWLGKGKYGLWVRLWS